MRPRLIHPIAVTLEQIDGAATTVDTTFREPVGAPAVRQVTLLGQLREQRGEPLVMTRGGADATSSAMGHVVFEIDTLTAGSIKLHVGDRIVGLAGATVRYRILRLEDHAHYNGRAYHRWAFYGPEDA
jgi:hypothetical protein